MQTGGNEFRTPRGINNENLSPSPLARQPSRRGLVSSTPQKEAFRKNINQKDFFEAFAAVVRDLNQFTVTTIIEDEIETGKASQVPVEEIEGQPGKRLVTIIDLVDGDITNIVGSRFLQNQDYSKLREQHINQVAKGQEIIKSNLEILQTAIKELIEIGKATGVIKVDQDED